MRTYARGAAYGGALAAFAATHQAWEIITLAVLWMAYSHLQSRLAARTVVEIERLRQRTVIMLCPSEVETVAVTLRKNEPLPADTRAGEEGEECG